MKPAGLAEVNPRRRTWRGSVALTVICVACGLPQPEPPPPGSFAFGVFGDGPYRSWELGRFRHVIEDANQADLQWFLHIGDILWFPCSDQAFASRLQALNSIRHPVVYTPGDNEWADCHEDIAGAFQPLERLRRLRTMFFANPGSSLGGRALRLESQSADSMFQEFVENARWRLGGFLFVTVHNVGSENASEPFTGRSAADDQEVARRTAAALAWMDDAFRIARSDGLKGLVLAFHADPGLEGGPQDRRGHEEFVDRLEELVKGFSGTVLAIHGDSHVQRVDQPLRDRDTGRPLPNFTRLETYGSPDIGWVRVVVDSVAGRIIAFEPRLMRAWWLW